VNVFYSVAVHRLILYTG